MEILIGILVVLILLILADGARRMLRERGNRLRLRIDPVVTRQRDAEVPESNPELVGSARVVRRTAATSEQPAVAPAVAPARDERDDGATATTAARAVPAVPADEGERPASGNTRPAASDQAAQQDLFGGEPAPVDTPPGDILEVIVVHLVAARDAPFPGRELLQQVLEQGMRFGEMNIFHRHSQGEGPANLQFSMANALEPGYFDVDEMENQTFRAVTFFMKLPGPLQPMPALERMLATARRLHETLGGELRDDQHSVLTLQTIEHLRQKVQDFERRQRLTHAH